MKSTGSVHLKMSIRSTFIPPCDLVSENNKGEILKSVNAALFPYNESGWGLGLYCTMHMTNKVHMTYAQYFESLLMVSQNLAF